MVVGQGEIQFKVCTGKCALELPIGAFGLLYKGKSKRRSECNRCMSARRMAWAHRNLDRTHAYDRKWRENRPARVLLKSARERARKLNLPFNISEADILIPALCPYLGIPLAMGTRTPTDNSPTLDRIVPSRGYVRGNVEVISHRANRIKNDGSAEEHEKIAKRMRTLNSGD